MSYYCDLYNYIKSNRSNLTVVLNPGTVAPEAYVECSDTLVLFEDDGSQWAGFTPPAYMTSFAPMSLVLDVNRFKIARAGTRQGDSRRCCTILKAQWI